MAAAVAAVAEVGAAVVVAVVVGPPPGMDYDVAWGVRKGAGVGEDCEEKGSQRLRD